MKETQSPVQVWVDFTATKKQLPDDADCNFCNGTGNKGATYWELQSKQGQPLVVCTGCFSQMRDWSKVLHVKRPQEKAI